MTQQHKFTLYVAEKNTGTDAAIFMLKKVFDKHLQKNYGLDTVDISKNPEIAEQKKILATPLIEKEMPPPPKRVLADLSSEDKIMAGLGIIHNRGGV